MTRTLSHSRQKNNVKNFDDVFVASAFIILNILLEPGTGADKDRLTEEITGKVFGGKMQEITDYKYVGPGNSTFVKAAEIGEFYGEMWFRVKKVEG